MRTRGLQVAEQGRYGQSDLAGNVWEWALDWFKIPYETCTNCACLDPAGPQGTTGRVIRGGTFNREEGTLLAARANSSPQSNRSGNTGARCARPPGAGWRVERCRRSDQKKSVARPANQANSSSSGDESRTSLGADPLEPWLTLAR